MDARMARQFLQLTEYRIPQWVNAAVSNVPRHKLNLGILPTPVHVWPVPSMPTTTKIYIKRDDMSGMELSGNKVRKLEFLLAEAIQGAHDCVVTIGGIQSNHCRATAVAARYLGLDCHLILRTSKTAVQSDPGLTGNLLVERLAGAKVHQVTKEDYTRLGSVALIDKLCSQLRSQGRNPYVIPVGGSNSLGMWGYLHAVEEIREQVEGLGITDIAMACGSGATLGGLALGVHLSNMDVRVHGYGVCDDPDYFYDFIDDLLKGMSAEVAARRIMNVVQAKGAGYAMSTTEELKFIKEVAMATGVILDPVYSGKALYKVVQEVQQAPEEWSGRNILFIHTGGLLGMYDKAEQLQELFPAGDVEQLPLA